MKHYVEPSRSDSGYNLGATRCKFWFFLLSNSIIALVLGFRKYYFKPFQNCTHFNGRATRSEFWFFLLFNFIIAFVLRSIGGMIKFTSLGNIYSLFVLLPAITLGARRMHDVNKRNWYLLIPIYNLILACKEGTNGTNQYGVDHSYPEIFRKLEDIK